MFNDLIYVAFPFIILFFSIISFFWFSRAFKKKSIVKSSIIIWLTTNIFFLGLSTYLFTIGLLKMLKFSFDYEKYNFLQWIAKYIFIGGGENSWIVFLIGIVSTIAIVISLSMMISFNLQNKKINDLNRNLAILKGKVAIDINELNYETSELTFDELKYLLEEQLAKEKLRAKIKSKIEKLSDGDISIDLDAKTLLNIRDNEQKNKRDN